MNKVLTRTKRATLRATLGRIVCVLMALTLVAGMCPAVAFADPSLTTKKKVLKTLKAYDEDGYYIVNTMSKNGDDIMFWLGGDVLFSDLDTMVHEECHGLSFLSDWSSENIYVGNQKSVKVNYTDVFRSKKTAKSVPKKLRTHRYDLYVAQPSDNLASDVQGAYGLLNEFMAYCWGFNTSVNLYAFAADKYKCTSEVWFDYLGSSADIALAYVEFRFFIEHYLYYAKKNNPAVYKGIMNNTQFKKAVKKIDSKFAKLIKKYDSNLKKIATKLTKAGYRVEITNGCFMMWSGYSAYGPDLRVTTYNKFVPVLNKSKYRNIERKLGLKKVTKRKIVL